MPPDVRKGCAFPKSLLFRTAKGCALSRRRERGRASKIKRKTDGKAEPFRTSAGKARKNIIYGI
ncbi:MAG: hypothetical protein ACR2F2_13505 [Pyrinomonadaceae bacterium]